MVERCLYFVLTCGPYPLMDDNSFPTQSAVSAFSSDGLVDVVDYSVDSNFAYPSLKSDLSVLRFTLEFTMALLNPLVNTKT